MKIVEGYKAGCCPVCGAQIGIYENLALNDNKVYRSFICSNCKNYGEETYLIKYSFSKGLIVDEI